jgi:hypothetical protein
MMPRPVYEALPHLYVVGGAIAALGIDPTYGRAAGVLLIFAGWTVFSLRREYRRRNDERNSL